MSIYYQDEHVTLYHGDCLTENREWLDADVLVTDPPYGMDYTGFGGRKGEPRRISGRLTVENDSSTESRDIALELWGADRPGLVFGKWNQHRPIRTRQRLIWDKRPCGYLGALDIPWASVDEEIYLLGKGFSGGRIPNIISAGTLMSSSADRPDHPTPKPVGLMELLIERCPTGVIADPFTGSGATLIAARNLGRKAVGVEMDERYCEMTAKRLAQGSFDFAAL